MDMPEIPFLYCCRFDYGSPLYVESVGLRHEVLRAPLNLRFTREQLEAEWDQWHLGLLDGRDRLLACLILVPHGEEIKMRQVAVSPPLQGRGLGKRLVVCSEALAVAHGFRTMILHARETAVPFYQAMGYQSDSERFEEVGIPHFRMKKVLAGSQGH